MTPSSILSYLAVLAFGATTLTYGSRNPWSYNASLSTEFHAVECEPKFQLPVNSLVRRAGTNSANRDRSRSPPRLRPIRTARGSSPPINVAPGSPFDGRNGIYGSPLGSLSSLLRSPLREPSPLSGLEWTPPASPRSPTRTQQDPYHILTSSNPVQTVQRQVQLTNLARPVSRARTAAAASLAGPLTSRIESDRTFREHETLGPIDTKRKATFGGHRSYIEVHGATTAAGAMAARGKRVIAAVDTRRGGTAAMRIEGPEGFTREFYGPGETSVKMSDASEGHARAQVAFSGAASASVRATI